MVSSCNLFLCLFAGSRFRFGLWFIGRLRFLPCLFLHEQDSFLFLDALMAFLVHLVVSILDFRQCFGHVLLCKVKQEACRGIAARCVLEIGNQIIPADDGFLLGCKVLDDVHLLLVREVMVGLFTLDADWKI